MTLRQPNFGSGTPIPPANRNIRVVTFATGSKTVSADDGIIQVDMTDGLITMVYDPTVFDPGAPAVTIVKKDATDTQCIVRDQTAAIIATLNAEGQSYDFSSLGSTTLVN